MINKTQPAAAGPQPAPALQPEALRIAMHLRQRAQLSRPGNLDTLSASGANELERQHTELATAQAEAKHWRSNHDNVVARLRIFTQRPDIPKELADRLPWYRELVRLQAVEAQALQQSAEITDAEIDRIAESMPGGLDGFLKAWGWRQFARAILQAAPPAPAAVAAVLQQAQRQAFIRGWDERGKAHDLAPAVTTDRFMRELLDVYFPPAAPAQEHATQLAGEPVAYLDLGAGGYLDIGTDLSDERLSKLPKGRHMLVIGGTYGVDGYAAAPGVMQKESDAAQLLKKYRKLCLEIGRGDSYHIARIDAAIAAAPAQAQEHARLDKPAQAQEDARDTKIASLTKAYTELSSIFHDQVVAQQAAWIEWQHGGGAEVAMGWIENGLCGPGNIPDEGAPYGKEAQAWYDANNSDPFPACQCGRPSNIMWMGMGFCCKTHHDAARAAQGGA